MANVALLRLDLGDGLAPGNKRFKLQHNLDDARRSGVTRLLSFGGPWSNHLHALAAVGHAAGLETVGIVRGETAGTAMLDDARSWGMRIVMVSRGDYRRRSHPGYLQELQARFGPCLLIPEGGANAAGARGCMAIGAALRSTLASPGRVVLAVGTGTTLAGVAAALPEAGWEVTGVSALKGAHDLEQRVTGLVQSCESGKPARWQILHDYHCGGFARVSPALREFMLAFEHIHGVQLEPVYTGKLLFAIHQKLASGCWDRQQPIVAIHSGGLQGRRGYCWLVPKAGASHESIGL
jgi:1-aminocyclopropane-1-carboxylate deaminase